MRPAKADGFENTAQATKAVWAGEEAYLADGTTQVPVVHSVAFGYHDLDEYDPSAYALLCASQQFERELCTSLVH
jgi:O-acetylhomoserine/O-acetylserine sulfhydrylase-like pyridoxal-dependent enzyme